MVVVVVVVVVIVMVVVFVIVVRAVVVHCLSDWWCSPKRCAHLSGLSFRDRCSESLGFLRPVRLTLGKSSTHTFLISL